MTQVFDAIFTTAGQFWNYMMSNWILSFFVFCGIISMIVSLVNALQGKQ